MSNVYTYEVHCVTPEGRKFGLKYAVGSPEDVLPEAERIFNAICDVIRDRPTLTFLPSEPEEVATR